MYTLSVATDGYLTCDENVTLALAVSGYLCTDEIPIPVPEVFRPEGIIGGGEKIQKKSVNVEFARNIDSRRIEDNEILTIIKIFLNLQ